jgi:opacity protein-like surface antigen
MGDKMIHALLLVLFSVSANAETIHLKDGTVFQGTITKTDSGLVDILIKKDRIDPEYYSAAILKKDANTGILVLKDGSYLHGTISIADADTVQIQIKKDRIGNIDYAVVQDTSSPTSQNAPIAIPETTEEASRRRIAEDDCKGDAECVKGRLQKVPGDSRRGDTDGATRSPLNEFHINAGGFIPLAKLTIQGQDDLAGPGYSFGAQYFRQLGPNFSTGLEIEKLTGSQHNSLTLINNLFTYSQFDSLSMMVLARLCPGEGKIRPFAIGGVGFHSTTIQINSFPQAGFAWADTHTVETRNVINATKSAAAFTLQAGANYTINDSVSFGTGVAYYYLAAATYDASPDAKKLGLLGINQALAGIRIAGDLNFRF